MCAEASDRLLFPLQIIFVAVYLLAGHSRHAVEPGSHAECPSDTLCSPSQRPAERSLSALPALPGVGFIPHPEDLFSCNWGTQSSKHARFRKCPVSEVHVQRSNSTCCDTRTEIITEGSLTGIQRTQSAPETPRTAAADKAKLWDIELALPSPRDSPDVITSLPTTTTTTINANAADLSTDATSDALLALHQPRS